jgi:ABC-type branched-subunit amino acid transport system permease subunit
MEFRLWIGVWIFVLLLILVVFNLSFLVKYITRFTEDCFATLVAIVFIIDAIKNVLNMRNGKQGISLNTLSPSLAIAADPNSTYFDYSSYTTEASSTKATPTANPKESPSVFYFSVLLFLLTFFICTSLTNFRKKPYLPSKVCD